MEDDQGVYDELEDDFLLLANEGKPALELVEETLTAEQSKVAANAAIVEFENKGVVIVRDVVEEQLQAMRAQLKARFGIVKKAEGELEEEESNDESEEDDKLPEDDECEDKDFEKRLEDEYADDQIGDVDGEVEQTDLISKEMLDEAVNEFIEQQKLRDRKLFRAFNDNEGPLEVVPMLRKTKAQLDAEEVETEQEKEDFRKKAFALHEILEAEFVEHGPEISSDEEDEEDDEKKWDCDTILTTFTNTDNHPGVIRTTRVVKTNTKNRMELHKQFQVPLEGLSPGDIPTATVSIQTKKEAKKALKEKCSKPFDVVEEI